MAETTISAIGYFMPIFAFLLVFIVIYALLAKTKVLGDSSAVMLFISFILASFFIVEASLVEWVQFSSAWFGVAVVLGFFIVALVALVPGIKIGDFFGAKDWFAWVLLALVVVFFIISSSYIFNWVVNWDLIVSWFDTEWFGMILLLAIAGIVSWKIKG